MQMKRDDGTVIGTESIDYGAGLQRPDGSYGNKVTMSFDPPKPKKNNLISSLAQSQQQSSYFPNNFPNGMKAPQVHLQTGEENTAKIGNFLKYLTDKRNAGMQQQYDAMNLKNRQFSQRLQNDKYQSQQNRLEKKYLQNQRLSQQRSQFDKSFDFNVQKFDRTHDLDMQKFQSSLGAKNNGEKYKLERTKIFTKNPAALVPEWDDLDEGIKRQVSQYYINTGTIPNIKKEDGWFSDTYSIDTQNKNTNRNKTNVSQKTTDDEKKQFLEWKKLQGNS